MQTSVANTEYWNRHKKKIRLKALLNEHSGETAAVVTSDPLVKFEASQKLVVNLDKLNVEALEDFGAQHFLWENAFYGDRDKMASVALAANALLGGSQYTYLFLSLLMFRDPDIQPDKSILYEVGEYTGHNVFRGVNRCMYDHSKHYFGWLPQNFRLPHNAHNYHDISRYGV